MFRECAAIGWGSVQVMLFSKWGMQRIVLPSDASIPSPRDSLIQPGIPHLGVILLGGSLNNEGLRRCGWFISPPDYLNGGFRISLQVPLIACDNSQSLTEM